MKIQIDSGIMVDNDSEVRNSIFFLQPHQQNLNDEICAENKIKLS